MMDPVRNFANIQVSIGYDHLATSIVLVSGHGERLPAPATEGAFNLVWFNWTDFRDPADDPNREIVRCTARVTDTLTVTRAQEGTTATAKNIAGKTYRMVLSYTRWKEDQIRNHPLTTRGDIPIHDGTRKVRLPIGLDGQALIARPILPLGAEWGTPPAGITSGWELIRTGTFTTDTNITGLDGNADRLWMLIIKTRHTATHQIQARFNNDAGPNYHTLSHRASITPTVAHDVVNWTNLSNMGFTVYTFTMKQYLYQGIIFASSGGERIIQGLSTGYSSATMQGTENNNNFWTNTTDNIHTINIISGTITAGEFFLFRRR